MADVGTAGDSGDNRTLGNFEPVGSPGTDTAGQPVVPEDLLTFGQMKARIVVSQKKVKKSEFRYSRAGRPNPVLGISSGKSGWFFTEEMLARVPFA